jgi:hypothetical protein
MLQGDFSTGMEGEGPVKGLIELERESVAATAMTASRAQQQFLECVRPRPLAAV